MTPKVRLLVTDALVLLSFTSCYYAGRDMTVSVLLLFE